MHRFISHIFLQHQPTKNGDAWLELPLLVEERACRLVGGGVVLVDTNILPLGKLIGHGGGRTDLNTGPLANARLPTNDRVQHAAMGLAE
jgi:hypothetical protein